MTRPLPSRRPTRPTLAVLQRVATRWQVSRRQRFMALFVVVVAVLALTGCVATPDTAAQQGPRITLDAGQMQTPSQIGIGLQILILLTVLSLAPALLIMVTSFTRVIIVLGFVRSALGAPQLPPNQVLIGLALFLTFFIMAPVWTQVNDRAIQPYMRGQISQEVALDRGMQPIREFMLNQTREKDLALFVEIANIERPRTPADVPMHVIIPAFVISELRIAFQMGFFIFIPFLIIELVVSSILMSMGMMMLPPSLVSLPFKVLLFVMADGWYLVTRSLVLSFG